MENKVLDKKYQDKIKIFVNDDNNLNNSTSIFLESNENEKFTIDKKTAKKSQLLKECIETVKNLKGLQFLDINSKYLSLIIEFLEHYKDSEPKLPPVPLENSNVMQYLDEWSQIFISKLKLEDIICLINTSNFMIIDCLKKICCGIIASEMVDKSAEELEKIFGIECDMTEEELKEFDKYPID